MFSPGIERAIEVTLAAHSGQFRKGAPQVPYAVHPIHAALMLARLGLTDVAIQAALLHDVVEDAPEWPLARIEAELGSDVARVVAQLTEDKSRSWEERKRAGLERVATMCADALAVKAADKLHNLESLARELARAEEQAAVWERFRGGRERTLALSAELVHILAPRVPGALGDALLAALGRVEQLASRGRL